MRSFTFTLPPPPPVAMADGVRVTCAVTLPLSSPADLLASPPPPMDALLPLVLGAFVTLLSARPPTSRATALGGGGVEGGFPSAGWVKEA